MIGKKEKKMDNITKYLNKIAYKFPKGYPDVNNPEEKAMLLEMVNNLIKEDEDDKITKNDLIKLINDLDLDDDQVQKLFNRTKNFTTYRPIKKTLDRKNYNKLILKKFSKEIQDLIEDLPKNEVDNFVNYLQDTDKKIDFPTNSTGNLFKTLSKTGVPDEVVSKIIYHTSQDEGVRGVGMGEVGMSLLFKNVGSSTSGKGDLSINGEEFEIKGTPATLGEKPFNLISVFNEKLGKYGIEVLGGKAGILFNDKKYGMNQLDQVLVDAYKGTDNKADFKSDFKEILTNDNKLGNNNVDARFNNIDFTNPESFNTEIGLMNFIRYADKEGFNHFLVHDFGKSGANTGKYIYVKGSPEEMANQLEANGVQFQTITPNLLRPRIGFGTTGYKQE